MFFVNVYIMKNSLYYLVCSLLLLSSLQAKSQEVEYIKIPGLEKILNNQEDKIHVVNFWATWCGPCVREFPVFERISGEYKNENVEFLMISLDFPSQIEKQLIPFLKKNNITLDIAVMMDVDYNAWIDKVDKTWQGDIPATLIFNNSKKQRTFHRGEINEQELRKLIDSYL